MSAARLMTAQVDELTSPEKHRANVLARAALVGVAVVELADGSYIATWRGWLKPCPNLAAVQHLVRQLGGSE